MIASMALANLAKKLLLESSIPFLDLRLTSRVALLGKVSVISLHFWAHRGAAPVV